MAKTARQPRPISLRCTALLVLMLRLLPAAGALADGGSNNDYEKDVSRAAEITLQWEASDRQWRREGNPNFDAHIKAQQEKSLELRRLTDKWKAAGRGPQFYRDYMARMRTPVAEPAAASAGGGTATAEYEKDVARAADLMRENSANTDRWIREGRPNNTGYGRRQQDLNLQIRALVDKWKAVGKGTQFYNDYTQAYRTGGTSPGSASAKPQTPGPHYRPRPAAGQGLLLLLLLVVGGPLGLYLFSRLFKTQPVPPRPASTTFGSAHYAPVETDMPRGAGVRGVFLGKSSAPGAEAGLNGPGAPVLSTPEHHTLIVARAGTGKGTRVIVPTLLRYTGPALVIDPKGENAAITARTRKDQLHQTIHILNPWDVLASAYKQRGLTTATYNPLDVLDRKDPNAVAIAQSLAGAICPTPSNAKDKFWQGSAADLLTGVLLWLAHDPTETKTLARAREVVSLSRQKLKTDFLIPMAATDAFGGAIREFAATFIDMAAETYSGIISNLKQSTNFLSDPRIKAATAKSSFAMDDLRRPTTVYVVIPLDLMDTQKTWLRLVVASAMHIFKHPKEDRPAGPRCLFLIDEFPALGRLDDLPRDIATMRGFGVDFALVVQGLDQLKAHYGEDKGTILSNCTYKWFCNIMDLDSARWLSDTLGKTTVETTSSSESFSASGVNKGSHSTSMSRGETGRPLLMPEEVLTLGREVAIALQPEGHPHYLKPIDYWDLPEAFAGLREKHGYLYWDPPLAYDENPYFVKEEDGKKKKEEDPSPRRNGKMTRKEALEVMELSGNPTREEIEKAYRRLMPKVHPDTGGSNWFAKELNEAKEVLLGA